MKISLIGVGIALFILLVGVVFKAQDETVMNPPNIIVPPNGENLFITEEELYQRLLAEGILFPGQTFAQLDVLHPLVPIGPLRWNYVNLSHEFSINTTKAST